MTSYNNFHRNISHMMHHFCDIKPNISKVHIDLSDLQNALIEFEDSIRTTKKELHDAMKLGSTSALLNKVKCLAVN